jgi:hypothetical protein
MSLPNSLSGFSKKSSRKMDRSLELWAFCRARLLLWHFCFNTPLIIRQIQPTRCVQICHVLSCVGIEEGDLNAVTLRIPSLHVFDEADNMLPVLATQHCESGSAKLLLNHQGHTISRDTTTVNGILDAVEHLQHRVSFL